MKKELRAPSFWLTVIPAALGSALALFHLVQVALTVADPEYTDMLNGFSGGVYLLYDIIVMSLPVCLLLFAALLINVLRSHALSKAWSISAIAACAVFLLCVILALILNMGPIEISLSLAARAIAESVTAVTLVHSLTRKADPR